MSWNVVGFELLRKERKAYLANNETRWKSREKALIQVIKDSLLFIIH